MQLRIFFSRSQLMFVCQPAFRTSTWTLVFFSVCIFQRSFSWFWLENMLKCWKADFDHQTVFKATIFWLKYTTHTFYVKLAKRVQPLTSSCYNSCYSNNYVHSSSRGGLVRLFVAQIQVEWGRRTVDRIPLGDVWW